MGRWDQHNRSSRGGALRTAPFYVLNNRGHYDDDAIGEVRAPQSVAAAGGCRAVDAHLPLTETDV